MEPDKPNPFDRQIRERLNAAEPQPDAVLWSDIAQRLDGSKRRRGGYFRKRYVLLLLMLALGGAAVWINERSGTDNTVATNYNATNNAQPAVANSIGKADDHRIAKGTTKTKSTAANNSQPTEPTNSIAAEQSKPTFTEQDHATESNAANQHTHNLPTTSSSRQTSASANRQPVKENFSAKASSKPNQVSDNNTQRFGISSTDNASNNIDKSKQDLATNHANASLDNTFSHSNPDKPIQNNAVEDAPEFVTPQIVDSLSAIAPVASDSVKSSENILSAVDSIEKSQMDLAHQPTKTTSTHLLDTMSSNKPAHIVQWKVGVYADMSKVTKSLSVNNSFPPQYVARRKSEEIATTAVSYGIRIGAELHRVNVSTGLGLRAYAEDVQYQNRGLCYVIVNKGIAATLYDTLSVHDGKNSVVATQNGKHVNRYIELPLQLGYRVGSRAFAVEPQIGFALGMPVSWSSAYLDKSITHLVNPRDANMLRSTVFTLLARMDASLAINRHLDANVGLRYGKNVQSVFKSSTGIDQRYRSVGGLVGLTYGF